MKLRTLIAIQVIYIALLILAAGYLIYKLKQENQKPPIRNNVFHGGVPISLKTINTTNAVLSFEEGKK